MVGPHGGALLATLLAEHGVRHVFGVPGGQTLALYDGLLDQAGLTHVLTRDERSAAYAADGYARVTGQACVRDATVGPGRGRAAVSAERSRWAPRCRWSPWSATCPRGSPRTATVAPPRRP